MEKSTRASAQRYSSEPTHSLVWLSHTSHKAGDDERLLLAPLCCPMALLGVGRARLERHRLGALAARARGLLGPSALELEHLGNPLHQTLLDV